MFDQRIDIDFRWGYKAAVEFGDADNFGSPLRHQLRSVRAHVAESLHDDAAAFALPCPSA